jgi:hypothetical protein
LVFDGDLSVSRAHFTDLDPVGDQIPGSVETVVSVGISVDSVRNVFASARLREFGARPLIEDNSVRSKATSFVNIEAGYKAAKNVRVVLDVFNVLGARDSDIDYYYVSRLPGEPAGGVSNVHFHPTLPRTARINVAFCF